MKSIGYRAAITWLANDAHGNGDAWLTCYALGDPLPQAARMVSDSFEVNEQQVRGDTYRALKRLRKAGGAQ